MVQRGLQIGLITLLEGPPLADLDGHGTHVQCHPP